MLTRISQRLPKLKESHLAIGLAVLIAIGVVVWIASWE
jgi:hypothetical protein